MVQRVSWSELTRLMSTPNRGRVEEQTSTPFLCMRLMCSQDQAEVDALRAELSKAGIVSEMRNHPVAEALGVSGVELWVQDERDFYDAANLFARMQGVKGAGGGEILINPTDNLDEVFQRVPRAAGSNGQAAPGDQAAELSHDGEQKPEEFEHTSSLLEREIEEMLECERKLAAECASLKANAQSLNQTLTEAQTALRAESQARVETEKKLGEEVAGLRSGLEVEKSQHEQTKDKHKREREQWQQELKSRDESLADIQQKFEFQSQFAETQKATLAKLREENLELQLQHDEAAKSLSNARAQMATEHEERVAAEAARAEAEQRAQDAELAKTALERQLLEQKHLQQKLQAHLANLNSLYSKLHAKRASRGKGDTEHLSLAASGNW